METIVDGYEYELAAFEGGDAQKVGFIHKEKNEEGDYITVKDGTTNEEVLAMLIDRLQFLNKKLASRETALAITKCQEALMWLKLRTIERKARGVEGTPEK